MKIKGVDANTKIPEITENALLLEFSKRNIIDYYESNSSQKRSVTMAKHALKSLQETLA